MIARSSPPLHAAPTGNTKVGATVPLPAATTTSICVLRTLSNGASTTMEMYVPAVYVLLAR